MFLRDDFPRARKDSLEYRENISGFSEIYTQTLLKDLSLAPLRKPIFPFWLLFLRRIWKIFAHFAARTELQSHSILSFGENEAGFLEGRRFL